MLSETNEIAISIGLRFESLKKARDTARKQLPGESEQMIDNVAWALWNPRIKYAEDMLPVQRDVFTRVRVFRDYKSITGYHAKRGAIGYVTLEWHGPRIVFEKASASLVYSDEIGQCGLRVPWNYLERVPHAA